MSLVLDTHREFLSDAVRLSAYRTAIEEVVRPGQCVVDLGSGTGIFGLMACRAGAAQVYSIEADGIVGVARKFAIANGFGDRIHFLRGLSTRIDIPKRADVVISDQMGRFGFEAGIVQYFEDARRRFLKPGGVLLPSSVQLWVAPVTCAERREHQEYWNSSPAGFDLHDATPIANNTGYPVHLRAEQLRSKPGLLATIDFYRDHSGLLTGATSFEIESEGLVHGIGGWFQAQLSPSVAMTNSPLARDRINRRNVFLPIEAAIEVKEGDRVTAKISIIPSEVTASWCVTVETGVRGGKIKKQKFAHSTLLGMLFSQEDLDKTKPDSIPKLTSWGEARRSVLDLIDGNRALGDIEGEMLKKHPDLFPSLKQAAVYVAEVVTRYTA